MSEPLPTPEASDLHGPILVLVRGLPGSGKTYLANTLQDVIGADKVVLLDPDTIDFSTPAYQTHTAALTEEGIEEKFHPYRFLLARMRESILAGKIIFWNQPFSDLGGFQRTIEKVRLFAGEHDVRLPIALVEMEISPETAKARVAERIAHGGHGPSPKRFNGYLENHISFADKGPDLTVTVNGTDAASLSAQTVIEAIRGLQT